MMSPLKDPLRIENIKNLEEIDYNEHIIKTEVKPKSKNCPSCGKYFEKDLNRHIGRVHREKNGHVSNVMPSLSSIVTLTVTLR